MKEYRSRTGVMRVYNRSYASARRQAERRKLIFALTEDQHKALMAGACVYCGARDDIGIDRVDNSRGYESDNVVSCCTMCNLMKRHHSVAAFVDRCTAVANRCAPIYEAEWR